MDKADADDRDEQHRNAAATEQREADDSGAKDGSSSEPDVPAPFSPDSDEESPLGDTDEHSDA